MKTLSALFTLACLWFQIYALAITIRGREDCLACVRDPILLARMKTSQDLTRGEMRRLALRFETVAESLARSMRLA